MGDAFSDDVRRRWDEQCRAQRSLGKQIITVCASLDESAGRLRELVDEMVAQGWKKTGVVDFFGFSPVAANIINMRSSDIDSKNTNEDGIADGRADEDTVPDATSASEYHAEVPEDESDDSEE